MVLTKVLNMTKKEDIIIMRISGEFKTFLKKKAKEKGVSLSKLIEERLYDTYKTDREQVLDLIAKRKKERPKLWAELDKSPIVREFEGFIATIFTEFINPISKDTEYQPVVLLGWIQHILRETIKHFDSIREEDKERAAQQFIGVGEILIDGLAHIKSQNKETQEKIIRMKTDLAEKVSHHVTSLAFAKDSYNNIRAELEKVCTEISKELKKK